MNRLGMAVSALGVALLGIGLIGLFTPDEDAAPIAQPTSTSADTGPGATTTSTTSTTTTSTTTTSTTTTSATTTTSSTVPPVDQTVEEFLMEFVGAIDNADVGFLLDRLHPVVLAQANADLCPAFIEREILALSNYQLTGDVSGPAEGDVAGTTVPDLFTAAVSFDFQGESFNSQATFAPADGQMRWFADCR